MSEKGWLAGFLKCDLCGGISIYTYHIDTKKIECTNCYNMAYYEPSSVEEWKNASIKEK
jgi:hypothetical protein